MSGVAGRSGRKAFVPNPAQRNMVKKLTGWGIPQQHICPLVTNPQTGKPLDRSRCESTLGGRSLPSALSPYCHVYFAGWVLERWLDYNYKEETARPYIPMSELKTYLISAIHMS